MGPETDRIFTGSVSNQRRAAEVDTVAPVFDEIIARVNRACAQTEFNATNIHGLADRLYGPVPEQATMGMTGKDERPAVNQVFAALERLDHLLGVLEHGTSRIGQIA